PSLSSREKGQRSRLTRRAGVAPPASDRRGDWICPAEWRVPGPGPSHWRGAVFFGTGSGGLSSPLRAGQRYYAATICARMCSAINESFAAPSEAEQPRLGRENDADR